MRGKVTSAGMAALGLILGLAVGSLNSGAQAEPLKIRGAWVAPISNFASIWLQKKDLAVHFGHSYVFESVRYAGTPPMITAIANNEVEIGNLAFSTLPIAIGNAGMDDIRVIGDDVAMRAMLRKHGLEANRDYTIIEAPFPGMKSMLMEKKVDLIPGVLPFMLDPELKKNARTLFDMKAAIGRSQFVMWSSRKLFIDAHRAVLVDFLEDSLRILYWYLDPKNHDAVAEIASQITKQPPERFGWVFTKNDYYRDPNLMPDLDALQKNVDMTHELGFVKASFDVKAHSDLSLIQEAAKRLK